MKRSLGVFLLALGFALSMGTAESQAGSSAGAIRQVGVYIEAQTLVRQTTDEEVQQSLILGHPSERVWARSLALDSDRGRFEKPEILGTRSEEQGRTELYGMVVDSEEGQIVRFYVVTWPK